MWSSQQTQPDTANTSFASESDYQKLAQSHGTKTNLGFLDLFNKLEDRPSGSQGRAELRHRVSQDSTQGSSSTFGSIDVDECIKVSCQYESEEQTMPPALSKPLSRDESVHPTAHQPVSSERSISPRKSKAINPSAAKYSQPKADPVPKLSPEKTGPATRKTPHQESPDRAALIESPKKITHHIANITKQGLFVDDIADHVKCLPYHVVFICQRIAIENSLTVQEIMQGMDASRIGVDPALFWETLQLHPNIHNVAVKESNRLWTASKRRFDGFTFKGQINLRNKQTGPIFGLRLMPVQADDSCRFQRRFGSDRFLYLNTPRLGRELDRFNFEEKQQIRAQWNEWLKTEHAFMGRK
jgi:hypothetical protein